MNIPVYIRHIRTIALAAAVSMLSFTACNNAIYDDEGDCSVSYRVRFRYDRNLKWADAFAHEVSSVVLYAFDKDGVLVWQCAEKIDPLTADDYSMSLDLPAGDYRLLAWCGLRNDGEREESFSVPAARVGVTRIEELQCALNRKHDGSGQAYSKERLYPLFHGSLDVELPADEDGGEYTYTMSLTKDTNHIRVILAHLSGEDVDVGKFTFRIEDENGLLDHENNPQTDETIEYRTWKEQNGEAGIGKEDAAQNRAIIHANGAIADLTVGRMVATHKKRMILTIDNDEGETVARVPVIDYALLAKDYYEEEYGHVMTDQEFLDREDDYVLTFFLDKNDEWLSSYILIHSWRVVPNDVNL